MLLFSSLPSFPPSFCILLLMEGRWFSDSLHLLRFEVRTESSSLSLRAVPHCHRTPGFWFWSWSWFWTDIIDTKIISQSLTKGGTWICTEILNRLVFGYTNYSHCVYLFTLNSVVKKKWSCCSSVVVLFKQKLSHGAGVWVVQSVLCPRPMVCALWVATQLRKLVLHTERNTAVGRRREEQSRAGGAACPARQQPSLPLAEENQQQGLNLLERQRRWRVQVTAANPVKRERGEEVMPCVKANLYYLAR